MASETFVRATTRLEHLYALVLKLTSMRLIFFSYLTLSAPLEEFNGSQNRLVRKGAKSLMIPCGGSGMRNDDATRANEVRHHFFFSEAFSIWELKTCLDPKTDFENQDRF